MGHSAARARQRPRTAPAQVGRRLVGTLERIARRLRLDAGHLADQAAVRRTLLPTLAEQSDPVPMTSRYPAFRAEFFGPVAMVFRVPDEAAAIALANDSDFGLGGSVWTRDVARGQRIASRVETGTMFVNNIDWSDAELPFGGIKNSGYGRAR